MTEDTELRTFTTTVWQHYELHGRHELPWRIPDADGTFDPYKILVSEVMLQQTQVPRVIPKYTEFLVRFPDVAALAGAPLGEVLTAWSGLGYNRRAKFLWQAAQAVQSAQGGLFPSGLQALVGLPGVGKNTAGAILAYAFNEPLPFIETNIRTVYIYHFFQGREGVDDAELMNLVERTLDKQNPRIWYWALMDYGAFIKQSMGNLNKLSKSYTRQSPFEGSRRQVRGQVVRYLQEGPRSRSELSRLVPDDRLGAVLEDLLREGLLQKHSGLYSLA